MKNTFSLYLLFLLQLLFAHGLFAQTLDSTFNTNGIAIHHLPDDDDGEAVALAADGKIVVASASEGVSGMDFLLMRFDSTGSLDTTFGTNGLVREPLVGKEGFFTDVLVQADGKIVSVGYSSAEDQFYVFRHTNSGARDSTFGQNGLVTTVFGTLMQGATSVGMDGNKIVVAGTAEGSVGSSIVLARYLPSGVLDVSFGSSGYGGTGIHVVQGAQPQLIVQPDGRMLLGCAAKNGMDADFLVARLLNNGLVDGGYGSSGVTLIDLGDEEEVTAIALDLDGRLIVAGNSENPTLLSRFAMVRLDTNGVLDSSFATNGSYVQALGSGDSYCNGLAVAGGGEIYLSGDIEDSTQRVFALLSFDSMGGNLLGCGNQGLVATIIGNEEDLCNDMVLYPDGRIILVGESSDIQGNSDVVLARYHPCQIVGVDRVLAGPEVIFFPNPAFGWASIRLQTSTMNTLSYSILDLQGRTVRELGIIPASSGGQRQEVDLRELSAGTYFLRIAGADVNKVVRFVVY
ncbi:MAG TPA: T9SS type A sorting domain-containing protein [Bacteroidetes bacterium]|nr:T9SS type A sorting domain-containing protein [Bacteroidota bacterium]